MAYRDNHVVTAAYIRAFADRKDQVRVIKKDRTLDKLLPYRDHCRERDFSVVMTDAGPITEREEQWSERESLMMPHIRRLLAQVHRGEDMRIDPMQEVALKVMTALHAARSYGFRDTFGRLWQETRDEYIGRAPTDPEVIELWVREYGRRPEPGEVAKVVRSLADDRRQRLFVDRQGHIFNKVLDMLRSMHLQVGFPPCRTGVHFITGDNPLVLIKDGAGGPMGSVAIGDSDSFYMPYARRLLVSFASDANEQRSGVFTEDQVGEINRKTWAACHRLVFVHPGTDTTRSGLGDLLASTGLAY